MKRKKYAVVVTTYGEVEAVTVRNLWPNSRRILKVVTRQIVKIPTAMIYFIADYRSTKRYIDWKLNRYRSSLLTINRAQKTGIAHFLLESGSDFFSKAEVNVFDAYYFVPPYLDDMLQQLQQEYDGIVVVPMIPVESAFSCGVACQMVLDLYGDSSFCKVRVMSKLWKEDRLHCISREYLFSQLSPAVRLHQKGKIGLVLVIHGTLVKNRAGNPPKLFTGLEETIAFFEVMKRKIMADPENIFTDVRQGCINHSTGGEWTADTIELVLEEFKREGYEGVVMFPYGFFADNSETEYDAWKKLAATEFTVSQYVRCINDSPAFARWLAGRVLEELETLYNLQGAFESLEHNQ